MLRIRKSRPGLYSLFILTLLLAIASLVGPADDEVPARFKPDRYQKVWERNPFTLVTPAAPQVRITPFDKLILVSWLNNGGPGISRQMQMQLNAQQQALQQAARAQPGVAQMQPGTVPTQPGDGPMPPRASEVRRKRITPPPSNE
jgi:hypothetical protein